MARTPKSCCIPAIVLILLTLGLTSCTRVITGTIVQPTVDNLQKQTDLYLVCEGAPAYLLTIDSMIASSPRDRALLRIGAQSYGSYITALSECGAETDRIRAIADKARMYGTTLTTMILPGIAPDRREDLDLELAALSRADVPPLFWGAMAWLSWIQQQQGSPEAMADLVLVEKIMTRLLALDESFQAGSIHLFFAALQATRPAMLGGDPETSRHHFERALELSRHRFLLVHTTYAETLARMTLDKDLHDRLLGEVIDFDIAAAPDSALANQIAKRKAVRLLAEEYFAE
ncbi:hypothetical protein JWG42_06990 [Desulfoprunum benzoelyticum]|uniref:TRAP transporter T-component n=1 Tax=Desulfoprunum benzoelyticum TaxID=1506996 RepID=A0A840USK9_9BACT|nr:TRAP transporter TatT component family protein [Desulfoprunum benzoelyticum]MBB5348635.1 hypothetical protein [Desulfoprunum benzoelyticum]MBM9529888.1 hypothetical protein [Desulfoprunum benzoelyticum]